MERIPRQTGIESHQDTTRPDPYTPIDPALVVETFTTPRPEARNEVVAETFSFFRALLTHNGFTEFSNVNEAYSTLPNQRFIVRREDPRQVLQLFSTDQHYDIGFPDGERYSNCVEWNPQRDGTRNISNAYLEGFTNLNSVVTVIGIEPRNDDDLVQLDDATQDFYGLERQGVRSFRGTVDQDRVKFINLRIPGHLLPETELTDDEIDRVDAYLEAKEAGNRAQPVMIHRAYVRTDTARDEKEIKKGGMTNWT